MRLVKRSALAFIALLAITVSASAANVLLTQQGFIRGSGGAGVDGDYAIIFTAYNSKSSHSGASSTPM